MKEIKDLKERIAGYFNNGLSDKEISEYLSDIKKEELVAIIRADMKK